MQSRDKKIWAAALLLSLATALVSFKDSYPPSWRMYLGMPGVLFGLYSGWLLDSRTIVLAITIAVNAVVYYWIVRGFLAFAKRNNR